MVAYNIKLIRSARRDSIAFIHKYASSHLRWSSPHLPLFFELNLPFYIIHLVDDVHSSFRQWLSTSAQVFCSDHHSSLEYLLLERLWSHCRYCVPAASSFCSTKVMDNSNGEEPWDSEVDTGLVQVILVKTSEHICTLITVENTLGPQILSYPRYSLKLFSAD